MNREYKSILGLHDVVLFALFVSMCSVILTAFVSFGQTTQNVSYQSAPKEVIEKFCQLDAQGKRLEGGTWQQSIAPLVTWVEEAGDMIFIISDYKIGKAEILDSTAKVPVKYSYLGSTDFIGFSRADKRSNTIIFELVKQKGEWKIERPITAPHVLWKEAIAYLRVLQNDEPQRKKQLDNIIRKIEKAAKQAKST